MPESDATPGVAEDPIRPAGETLDQFEDTADATDNEQATSGDQPTSGDQSTTGADDTPPHQE
jgi:hypothetical protein